MMMMMMMMMMIKAVIITAVIIVTEMVIILKVVVPVVRVVLGVMSENFEQGVMIEIMQRTFPDKEKILRNEVLLETKT